jgi:hypothetical protein
VIWTTPEQHRKHFADDPAQQSGGRATGSDDFEQVEQAIESSQMARANVPTRVAYEIQAFTHLKRQFCPHFQVVEPTPYGNSHAF